MEVKVDCDCGTRYKFEVEPVDGHMPQAVKCPACGANGTAQANAAIREALGSAAPLVVEATQVAAPASMPAAPPGAKPPAVRLSVQRPAEAPASHAGPVTVASFRPGAAAPVAAGQQASGGAVWKARGKKALQLAWKGVLLLLCGLAMLAGFGGKKGRGLRSVVRLASAVIRANAADDEEMKNLGADDVVLLLIKHPNETDVADACTDYWQETHKKKVAFVTTNTLAALAGEDDEDKVAIMPAYHGCVQIVGGLKWGKEDFEKLTEFLSQKFSTVGVATRNTVDSTGGYIFGVFDGGEKKFHAEMETKGAPVTVEGEQWAREHGYKPGKKGFNGFHLADGDRITQKLGFDIADAGSERILLLTEVGTPPPTTVTNRVAAGNRVATNRAPTRAGVPAQVGKAR